MVCRNPSPAKRLDSAAATTKPQQDQTRYGGKERLPQKSHTRLGEDGVRLDVDFSIDIFPPVRACPVLHLDHLDTDG